MEGLVSEESKEKLELLKEYAKEDNIIFMNSTETWIVNIIENVLGIWDITF